MTSEQGNRLILWELIDTVGIITDTAGIIIDTAGIIIDAVGITGLIINTV